MNNVSKFFKKFLSFTFIKNIFNHDYNSIIEIFLRVLNKLNLLKPFSKLYNTPINKKIICFGSMMGKEFIDNPKYLFLYLISKSNYHCYWFTSSRNVFNRLKENGYSVVFNYSFKAIKILNKAGYLIFGWGLGDFIRISFSKDTVKILTWHGHQFKRLDTDWKHLPENERKKIFRDYGKNFYMISPSKSVNKFISSAFQIESNKIFVTGLPRNDIFFQVDEKFIESIKKKYNISKKFKRIILYAPTFRNQQLIAEFPLNEEDFKDLNNFLKVTNTLLICKAHFANKVILFKNSNNVKVIEKFVDIQELVIISDILITDYSTIYFDFILMQKPAILFTYDLEQYIKYPGIYHKLEDIAIGPIVKNGKELVNSLKTSSNWIPKFKNRIIEVRNKYWDYHDGNSCERFFNKFNLKLNLNSE